MTATTAPIIFFVRNDPNDGPELWASDGVPGHEYRLTNALGDGVGTNPSQFVDFNGKLFFTGDWLTSSDFGASSASNWVGPTASLRPS